MLSRPSERSNIVLAALVAVIAFVALAATMDDVGLTWDEPAYMASAQSMGEWFTLVGQSILHADPGRAFAAPVLVKYWQHDQSDQHPPIGKLAPAISWRLLRGMTSDITAMRLGSAAVFAALVGLVCLFGAQFAGAAAGLFAAASLVLMPRLFFHGHLVTLDIPVSFFYVLTVWLFWRWAGASRRRWPTMVAMGIAYGLALGTKNTSFILPIAFCVWLLIFRRDRRTLTLLIGMGVIAAIVFVLSWPLLYVDPVGRLTMYVQKMTVGHWDIVQYYLGQNYTRPPWHYPFVITLAIMPITLLVMSLLGLLRIAVAGRSDAGGWLIALNALIPLLFFGFVSSQVYGSERLFLVVFPFLALLAGVGFECVWRLMWSATNPFVANLAPRRRDSSHSIVRTLVATSLAALLLLPGAAGIANAHAYELSYFSESVGGLAGAERLGLALTYWCDTYRGALPFLNSLPEESPSVWTEEDGVLYLYQKAGMLRADIKVGGRVATAAPSAADYALIQRRPSGYTPEIETLLKERQPVFVVTRGDTPLAYVFKIK